MTDEQKATLLQLINDVHDSARDYGHARGNNDAYHLAKSKKGLYFADAIGAAMKADAALDNLVDYISYISNL